MFLQAPCVNLEENWKKTRRTERNRCLVGLASKFKRYSFCNNGGSHLLRRTRKSKVAWVLVKAAKDRSETGAARSGQAAAENADKHPSCFSQMEITDESQMFSEWCRSCLFPAGQVIQPPNLNTVSDVLLIKVFCLNLTVESVYLFLNPFPILI